jgi:hypothetical protein
MIFMKNMEENIMKYLEFGPFGAVEVEASSPPRVSTSSTRGYSNSALSGP